MSTEENGLEERLKKSNEDLLDSTIQLVNQIIKSTPFEEEFKEKLRNQTTKAINQVYLAGLMNVLSKGQ